MGTTAPPPPLPPPPAPIAARGSSGRAVAALVCGISALATGFLFLTLLVAVVGNVLASFALQDIGASGGRLGGRSLALWGIACGVAAIVIWGTVGIVVAVREA